MVYNITISNSRDQIKIGLQNFYVGSSKTLDFVAVVYEVNYRGINATVCQKTML